MKTLQQVELKQVSRAFAVANTPLFLLRKLREDEAVREISKDFSGDEILERLKELLQREPETLRDHVAPYAYLVALAQKPDDRHLRMAALIPDPPKWGWFDYIRRVLLETYSPTKQSVILIPGRNDSPAPHKSSDVTTERRIIFLA